VSSFYYLRECGVGVIDRLGSARAADCRLKHIPIPCHPAGVTDTAIEWAGPFGKLRAGSSARKERGPQDDKVVGFGTALLLSSAKTLSIGRNYTIEPKWLTTMEI
jgi:hypothetical protein